MKTLNTFVALGCVIAALFCLLGALVRLYGGEGIDPALAALVGAIAAFGGWLAAGQVEERERGAD